ncbi:MAG TPA: FkbM family methyltransferase [Candidatus Paceibacterota bacterium]
MKTAKHYFWIFSNFYGRMFGRAWLAGAHHALLNLSLHGLGYDNGLYPSYSGEEWFIKNILKKEGMRICLDIGANVGSYSHLLLKHLNCKVYAMEPSLLTFTKLQKLSALYPHNFSPVQTAIADFDGSAQLFSRAPLLGTATLQKSILDNPAIEEPVKVSTVDTLVKQLAITRVDFIKIDTEGFEREVLLGAQETLRVLKPKYIQFEFNLLHLRRGYTVFDLAQMLPEYELYRLLPQGWLKVDPKSFLSNIFMLCNIVAKRKAE